MPSLQSELAGVKVRNLKRRSDERGWLTEIYRSDEVASEMSPKMAYVSVTRPGVGRGPHEHRHQTDVFCFIGIGTFHLQLWDNRPSSPTYGKKDSLILGEDEPAVVVIPPGVVHGYKNVGDDRAVVINLPNRIYKGTGRNEPVDEIRYEDNSNSPFILE